MTSEAVCSVTVVVVMPWPAASIVAAAFNLRDHTDEGDFIKGYSSSFHSSLLLSVIRSIYSLTCVSA